MGLSQNRFGIEAVEFGAAQQAVERCRALAAAIAAGEQDVLASQRDAA